MKKDIVFFDLETTGTDVCTDRIVQIGVQKLKADLTPSDDIKTRVINPGVHIPEGATAVHGITDEMVTYADTFANIAKSLFQYIDGCDVGGFNILRFDVPLLSEEFARVGIEWPADDTNYFDAYKIFANKEPRDLAGAYMFYCGKQIEGAHDAGNDIKATIEVFTAQLQKYPDLGEMEADKISEYCRGANALDLAGNIIVNDAGVAVYARGKHAGKPVTDRKDYASWMMRSNFPQETKKMLQKIFGYNNL